MLEKYLKVKMQAKKLWNDLLVRKLQAKEIIDNFQVFRFFPELAKILALLIPMSEYSILGHDGLLIILLPLFFLIRSKSLSLLISRRPSMGMLLEPLIVALIMTTFFFPSFISASILMKIPQMQGVHNFIALFLLCFLVVWNTRPKKLVLFRG